MAEIDRRSPLHLDVRDLRLVLTVAEAGSLSRAADALHLAQSTLSHHLAELEGRLGAPLFLRLGRRLQRTPLGDRLVAGAAPPLWPATGGPLPIDLSGLPRVAATTDDWPYLYLERPGLPMYHALIAAVSLVLAVLMRRQFFASGESSGLPMLLLGMGFMLLEVVGVSRAALLYGTTWTVNAYVVGAILGMILFANLVASRFRFDPVGWPAAGLLMALLAHTLLPTSALVALPPGPRIVLGGFPDAAGILRRAHLRLGLGQCRAQGPCARQQPAGGPARRRRQPALDGDRIPRLVPADHCRLPGCVAGPATPLRRSLSHDQKRTSTSHTG